MDFTTIITGPAQAGPQSPVSNPGIGHAAGAGCSPSAGAVDAPGDAGFASLVALALGLLDGSNGGAEAAASGSSRHGLVHDGAAVEETVAAEATADDEAPVDAPVDAATLAVLIALATPTAAPVAASTAVAAPEPDAGGAVDLAVTRGAPAETSVTSPADTTSRQPVVPDATQSFEDVGADASMVPTATAVSHPAVAQAPGSPGQAPDAAAPGGAASEPAPVASAPAAGAATSAVPTPAATIGAAPPVISAAASPDAGPRGVGQPAAHPLRQALAAMTAQSPATATDPAANAAAAPVEPAGTASPAIRTTSHGAAPVPVQIQAGDGSQEVRAATVSRVDVPAAAGPAAAFTGASDAGATGGRSSDSAGDGSAAPAFLRPTDLRFDLPAAAGQPPATATAGPDAVVAGAVASLPAMHAGGPSPLAAVDVPAAVRFEQALSSLDPDVRNLQAMVRTVRLFTAGSGATEARLTLEPEHLGPVALTVRVEQGSVSAHFRAETPAAHRWIETHQQELRTGLREQGLEVKELVVTTDPDGRRERRQDAQPARPARSRRPQTADTPRFEVVV